MSEVDHTGRATQRTAAGAYLVVAASWVASLAAITRLHERSASSVDVISLGLASHALARIVTTDTIAAPLRAPFVEHRGKRPVGPRGSGLRYAIGELLSCPYCCTTWAATGLLAASSLRPQLTGVAVRALAATAVGNLLHRAHAALERQPRAPHRPGSLRLTGARARR